jgi:hypothetical protein
MAKSQRHGIQAAKALRDDFGANSITPQNSNLCLHI